MLTAPQVTIGGWRPDAAADVMVRCDWPRTAGMLQRRGGDYFFSAAAQPAAQLIKHAQTLPVGGSAQLTLHQPSPLSATAVLKLAPPHRLDQHVDEVVLVDQTLLIGPGGDNHIRHRQLAERVILLGRRSSPTQTWQWWAKQGSAGDLQQLTLGQPMVLESLTMTLEQA